MYQENNYRTFNIWRDGDLLHVFITVPVKKYEQYKKTIDYVKSILGMNFDLDFDDNQFYFLLTDFNEYNEFKEYFYRYLPKFAKENK